MKDILDVLIKNNIVCKKLEKIDLKTRKKIKVFLGLNVKNEYCIIIEIMKKSRFLKKDYNDLITFLPSINFKYKRKILILNSSICNKVKKEMKDWKIIYKDIK
jgi:hypothetical protein